MEIQNYIERNKSSYDKMSSDYRNRREKGGFKIYPDIITFVDLVEENFSNPRVLDIGPGAGVILKYFSNREFRRMETEKKYN